MPDDPEIPVPEADKEKIMHVSLPISKEEADQLYSALSYDGKLIMSMNTTFWGSYFGMLTDQFGVQWMLSFDESDGKK